MVVKINFKTETVCKVKEKFIFPSVTKFSNVNHEKSIEFSYFILKLTKSQHARVKENIFMDINFNIYTGYILEKGYLFRLLRKKRILKYPHTN